MRNVLYATISYKNHGPQHPKFTPSPFPPFIHIAEDPDSRLFSALDPFFPKVSGFWTDPVLGILIGSGFKRPKHM